jgi:hypothetical protein
MEGLLDSQRTRVAGARWGLRGARRVLEGEAGAAGGVSQAG